MFGVSDLWLFVVTGIILNILPGPDSMYIIARSASQGFKAGSIAALGTGTGTIFHIFVAAFGFSAILETSAFAYNLVKFIGGIYLLYLAFTILVNSIDSENLETKQFSQLPLITIFTQGLLTNLLNPKVALFFLAFVPQFISPESENKIVTFMLLGLIFNTNGMIWCHFLAWSSSVASRKVKQNKVVVKWLQRGAGGLFIYFSIRLVLNEQH